MVLGLNLSALSYLQQLQTVGFLFLLIMVAFNVGGAHFLFGEGEQLALPDKDDDTDDGTKKIEADSLYCDILSDPIQLSVMFIAQTCLFLYVFYASFVTYKESHVTYGYWLTAYLVQMCGMFNRQKKQPTWAYMEHSIFPWHDQHQQKG